MCGSPEKAFDISNKLTHVVLTNGGSDATFIERGQLSKSVPIPPVSSLKSAIGAGDCVGEFLRGAKQRAFDSVCTVYQCTWLTLLHGRLCILYRFLTYNTFLPNRFTRRFIRRSRWPGVRDREWYDSRRRLHTRIEARSSIMSSSVFLWI